MQSILERNPDLQVAVFVVWQSVLPTDWSTPGASVLARVTDRRVRQYWDKGNLIAGEFKKADATSPVHPTCCNRKGILWDLAAVYKPGRDWQAALPAPSYADGPVVDVAGALEAALRSER